MNLSSKTRDGGVHHRVMLLEQPEEGAHGLGGEVQLRGVLGDGGDPGQGAGVDPRDEVEEEEIDVLDLVEPRAHRVGGRHSVGDVAGDPQGCRWASATIGGTSFGSSEL